MNISLNNFVLTIAFMGSILSANASESLSHSSTNQKEIFAAFIAARQQTLEESWISRSDIIASVRITGVDSVRLLKRSDDPKIKYNFGSLTTFKVEKTLFQRQAAGTSELKEIYVYKDGINFNDPYSKLNDVGIVFLRSVPIPALATNGIAVTPAMPISNYFDFAIAPPAPGMSAFLSFGKTNLISSFEKELQNKTNPKTLIRQRDPNPIK